MTDIEIAQNTNLENIIDIAKKAGIKDDYLELYGKNKAKISEEIFDDIKEKKDGKLILVTAMSPTPLGEGKTTISIAIADALQKIGKKAMLVLREPSLGPVFGIKGGATGGGMAQVAPMEDINLHFTGDIHAITVANNLLSSIIDNHIYFGNELQIEKVVWKRCLDLNDRQLRKVNTGLSGEKNIVSREDEFCITVASEIMAIVCLAKDIYDLKRRLGNIIIGYNKEKKPIYAKDLKAEGAMAVLLKDAIKPNLVQTLEHTPTIIHGGPFANIAHGCNSIIATKLAMKLSEYVVTEAGFGADLGAEKFFDIKCRKAQIIPNIVVIVATIKAMKYHGGIDKEHVQEKNIMAIKEGIKNLYTHIDNIKNVFKAKVVVALNHYANDDTEEIDIVKDCLEEISVPFYLVDGWEKGGEGAMEISREITKDEYNSPNLNFVYQDNDTIKEKIEKVATKIYRAKSVNYSDEALEEIKKIESMGYSNLPICIAKTQYSFSDDAKNVKSEGEYNITVKKVELKAGAEFIVVIAENIMTMPGLPKIPAAEKIDINENGKIEGIF